MKHVITITWI